MGVCCTGRIDGHDSAIRVAIATFATAGDAQPFTNTHTPEFNGRGVQKQAYPYLLFAKPGPLSKSAMASKSKQCVPPPPRPRSLLLLSAVSAVFSLPDSL